MICTKHIEFHPHTVAALIITKTCLYNFDPLKPSKPLTCAPIEDPSQPASDQIPRCLHEEPCIIGYSKRGQWRFLSDCANAQADLTFAERTYPIRLRFLTFQLIENWMYIQKWALWGYAGSEDPDHLAYPCSLTKDITVRLQNHCLPLNITTDGKDLNSSRFNNTASDIEFVHRVCSWLVLFKKNKTKQNKKKKKNKKKKTSRFIP